MSLVHEALRKANAQASGGAGGGRPAGPYIHVRPQRALIGPVAAALLLTAVLTAIVVPATAFLLRLGEGGEETVSGGFGASGGSGASGGAQAAIATQPKSPGGARNGLIDTGASQVAGAAAGGREERASMPEDRSEPAGAGPAQVREHAATAADAATLEDPAAAVGGASLIQPVSDSSDGAAGAPPEVVAEPPKPPLVAGREYLQVVDTADAPKLELSGIIFSDRLRLALINGMTLEPGDTVEGVEVIAVEAKRVRLRNGDKAFVLRMP